MNTLETILIVAALFLGWKTLGAAGGPIASQLRRLFAPGSPTAPSAAGEDVPAWVTVILRLIETQHRERLPAGALTAVDDPKTRDAIASIVRDEISRQFAAVASPAKSPSGPG